MKRILIPLCLVVGCHVANGQRSYQYNAPDRLFVEGKELFELKNYAGCIDKLEAYKQKAWDLLVQVIISYNQLSEIDIDHFLKLLYKDEKTNHRMPWLADPFGGLRGARGKRRTRRHELAALPG